MVSGECGSCGWSELSNGQDRCGSPDSRYNSRANEPRIPGSC
jgi:hypothetical protein